ncbi:unnamed protein product [Acanthoscelides obtectus]|nr:unnamed protein product [Acanthoscelides obtectus]CAK1630297.1 hypothetical protein AOBTE_LOCUS6240 [Acanthoscelides obtectus]
MKSFLVLLLAVILSHNTSSSSAINSSCDHSLEIRTVLEQKCSTIASQIMFKLLPGFEHCPKWCQLKEIKALRKDNEKDVLCLLLTNSFISFCTTFKDAALQNVNFIPPNQVNPVDVCTKLLEPKQSTEFNISAIIPSKKACEIVCSNYDDDTPVVKECALAFYFRDLNSSAIANFAQKTADLTNHGTIGGTVDQKHLAEHVPNVQEQHKQDTIQNIPADTQSKLEAAKPADISGTEQQKSANVGQTKQMPEKVVEPQRAPKAVPPGKPREGVVRKDNLQISAEKNAKQDMEDSLAPHAGVPETPHVDTVANQQEPSINTAESVVQHSVDDAQKAVPHYRAELPDSNPETPSLKNKAESGKDEQSADNVQGHPPPPVQDPSPVEDNPPEETIKDNTEPKLADEEEEEQMAPKEEDAMTPNERNNAQGFSHDEEDENNYEELGAGEVSKSIKKKLVTSDEPASYNNLEEMDGESYFFSYFMAVCVLFVLGYVVYHNRQK